MRFETPLRPFPLGAAEPDPTIRRETVTVSFPSRGEQYIDPSKVHILGKAPRQGCPVCILAAMADKPRKVKTQKPVGVRNAPPARLANGQTVTATLDRRTRKATR